MRPAALLGLLALAACSADAQQASRGVGRQVVVTDGDTIKIAGERIRLSNIDTPELPPGAKCWAEGALAIQSAEAMQGMIDRAKALDIDREGKDRYGRTLARVRFNGVDVGEALISRGLAAKWTGRRWDWCAPSSLKEPGGPSLMSGPEGNSSYTSWAAAHLSKVAR